jgi:hypothetical protein
MKEKGQRRTIQGQMKDPIGSEWCCILATAFAFPIYLVKQKYYHG